MPQATWTEEEIDLLKSMAKNGQSANAIAKRIGKTRSAVIGKCNRDDIPLGSDYWKNRRTRKPKIQKVKSTAPKKKAAPVKQIQPDPVPPAERPSILSVGYGQCRFPMWPDDGPVPRDSPLCGAPTGGYTYCRTHSAICKGGLLNA